MVNPICNQTTGCWASFKTMHSQDLWGLHTCWAARQETYVGLKFISIFWLCMCICEGTVKTHGIRQVNLSKNMHCTLPPCVQRDSEHFPFYTSKWIKWTGEKKKGYTCVPYSLPVAFILNLCNLQVKRLVQLFSATTVAVRVHQKNLKLFFDFISYNTDLGSSS